MANNDIGTTKFKNLKVTLHRFAWIKQNKHLLKPRTETHVWFQLQPGHWLGLEKFMFNPW